jgi:hypothetical protein
MIVFSLVPEEAARVGVRVDGGEVYAGKDGICVERSFEFDSRTYIKETAADLDDPGGD